MPPVDRGIPAIRRKKVAARLGAGTAFRHGKQNTLGFAKQSADLVQRSDQAKGFELPPQHWMVEHTTGWLTVGSIAADGGPKIGRT